MAEGWPALLFVACAFGALALGYPVAFTLGGVAVLAALIAALLDVGAFAGGDFSLLLAVFGRVFSLMDGPSEILTAVPMFVAMGAILERSKIAEALLSELGGRFRGAPGGLALGVVLVGALLAASTGIVGATVVTMGLVSLPTMLKAGYDARLASGVVCASGTLGQIIPPSIVLVLLGDMVGREWMQARRLAGDWAPEPVTVGDLFAGALIPGLVLVALYAAWIALIAWRHPERAPAIAAPLSGSLVRALLAPAALIALVLGSILAGIATPLEAASLGALGALLLAGAKRAGEDGARGALESSGFGAIFALAAIAFLFDLRLGAPERSAFDSAGFVLAIGLLVLLASGCAAASFRLARAADVKQESASLLSGIALDTARMTAMVFAIFIGAQIFNVVFKGLGGDDLAREAFALAPGGPWGALFCVLALVFVMGFFLDFLEILFVAGPIVLPILFGFVDASGEALFDPIWIAVLLALNLQTSFLTPPFGFALFYLRGAAPASLETRAIWAGAWPFVLLQLIGLAAVALLPSLATWLPAALR